MDSGETERKQRRRLRKKESSKKSSWFRWEGAFSRKDRYLTVSENMLWSLVAEESSLNSGVGSALRSVFNSVRDRI